MDRPESLVLTEDNYFDYLIGVTRHADIIPPAVLRAWNDNALMFLGFQIEDWNFRVLFRSIMNQEGRDGVTSNRTSPCRSTRTSTAASIRCRRGSISRRTSEGQREHLLGEHRGVHPRPGCAGTTCW